MTCRSECSTWALQTSGHSCLIAFGQNSHACTASVGKPRFTSPFCVLVILVFVPRCSVRACLCRPLLRFTPSFWLCGSWCPVIPMQQAIYVAPGSSLLRFAFMPSSISAWGNCECRWKGKHVHRRKFMRMSGAVLAKKSRKIKKTMKNLRVGHRAFCMLSVRIIFLHISICKDDAASMPPAAITLSFPSWSEPLFTC